MRRRKFTGSILILLIAFLLGIPAVYNLPPVQERLGWRFAELFARFKYALSPPEQIVFVPEEESTLPTQTVSPQSSLGIPLFITATPIAATNPVSSPAPTKTFTPIPEGIQLTGFRHEFQTWNNCGSATLGMALSYWGWDGDQGPIA